MIPCLMGSLWHSKRKITIFTNYFNTNILYFVYICVSQMVFLAVSSGYKFACVPFCVIKSTCD